MVKFGETRTKQVRLIAKKLNFNYDETLDGFDNLIRIINKEDIDYKSDELVQWLDIHDLRRIKRTTIGDIRRRITILRKNQTNRESFLSDDDDDEESEHEVEEPLSVKNSSDESNDTRKTNCFYSSEKEFKGSTLYPNITDEILSIVRQQTKQIDDLIVENNRMKELFSENQNKQKSDTPFMIETKIQNNKLKKFINEDLNLIPPPHLSDLEDDYHNSHDYELFQPSLNKNKVKRFPNCKSKLQSHKSTIKYLGPAYISCIHELALQQKELKGFQDYNCTEDPGLILAKILRFNRVQKQIDNVRSFLSTADVGGPRSRGLTGIHTPALENVIKLM